MLLIKNANLISMEEVNYEIKDILVENGKIIGVGSFNPKDYPNCEVIDALGKYVTPGLVDPHCHVGMIESTIGWAGSDANEMSNPITPELRAIDGVKPHDECFVEALDSGVTTVCTGPGSANVIGQLSVVGIVSRKEIATQMVGTFGVQQQQQQYDQLVPMSNLK